MSLSDITFQCLAVASGLWLGKEGPLVHVACCCANLVMKPIDTLKNNEARKREVLSAAAASGISVAFGSPIGGVLFSLEQLSYYFPDKTMWQSFVCAMVAAVTLQAINPFRTGKIVLYQVEYSSGWHGFEMLPFALLGIIGGVYGGLFIKLNMLVAKFRRSNANPLRDFPVVEVLIVSILTAFINYPNTMMRGQSSELVHSLFSECNKLGTDDIFGLCKITTAGTISMVSLLLTASALGFLLTTVTFGLQIPAGIILPSLAIGALYGRALGVVVDLFQKHHPTSLIFSACEPDIACITPGTYAIIGAASALAGVTRMTVSIVVIMFELTGALTYVLPIMIAVMLSKWIGDAFSKRGIYESWIQFNEYPYIDNKDDTPAPDVKVSNIMTSVEEMVSIDAREEHSIQSLRTLLSTTTYRGFPVILSTASASGLASSSLLSPLATPERATTPFTVTTTKSPTNTLLGYISRTELTFALTVATSPTNNPSSNGHSSSGTPSRNLPPHTPCFFTHDPTAPPLTTLDLRPWMDQTPMTLNSESSLQLAVNMFQRLGLRYLLFVERGALRGLLTKKDLWWVLNTKEMGEQSGFVPGVGVLREENGGGPDGVSEDREEERGLLAREREVGRSRTESRGRRPRSDTIDTLDSR
jgi:chloride channel 3/4/5